jgi:cob(I)alamin adenosyltransferase
MPTRRVRTAHIRVGHRLTKIYTRTGDTGETGLGDGSRVAKDSLRVEAIGTVDELNSCIGVVLAEPLGDDLRDALIAVQHDLFELGGELSIPGHDRIAPGHVERLEQLLDRHNADLPPLKDFILPGGSRTAALCHLARTVCRRAERRLVAVASGETRSTYGLQYLNRLSDLLFVLSRVINRRDGHADVLWQKGRKPLGGGN